MAVAEKGTDAIPASVPRLFKRKEFSKRVLLPGSGPTEPSAPVWRREGYEVITLDIDPRSHADITANMTAMGEIGSFDAIYCCHALEHLYPHEVGRALSEFLRVLAPGGTAIIMVPDLEGVQPTDEPLSVELVTDDGRQVMGLTGEGGPITGLHLFYGDASQIEQFPHMAHHSGFIQNTLERAMKQAGFSEVNVRRAKAFNLLATGKKA